jgi:hypothetical protein
MKNLSLIPDFFEIDAAINEGLRAFCKEAGYTVSVLPAKPVKQKVITLKKAAVLLFICMLVTIVTLAQPSFAVKAGLNRYALTGDDQSYITDFHAGGLAQIKLTKLFTIQPELLFSKEGNAYEEDDIKVGTYLNYLSVPIMAQINTSSGFYAEAGPGFAFLLNATYKETGSPAVNIKQSFKSSNLFLGAGTGYRSKIGLGIGIRYNFGMANISAAGLNEMKTTGGHISIFYVFSSKKK